MIVSVNDLSAEQRTAVERTGQDVCVVAGPGSGKTRVLVERFAWLVEEQRIPPARILAITFTEKAANEMKQRLVKRFEHRPELRQAVERAWLFTIDAFCTRLLGENAIAAGLPPDFRVIEQAAAERLRREAAEKALDGLFHERPAEMRRLLEALDLATGDDGRRPDLAGSLLEAYETMRVSGVRDLPAAQPPPDVLPLARELAETMRRDPAVAVTHAWAERFLALRPEPVTSGHLEVLASFEFNLNKLGSRKAPGYRAARQLKGEVLPQLEAQWVQAWHAGLPELLREAMARLDAAYRERKRQQAVVDFGDLEERAIELLESDATLHKRIRQQFDHLLMDELQDTNRMQWRLVNLLRVRHGFFAVGDINQSIYGFRHADPAVFEEYRTALRAAGAHIDELKDNYRSRQQILDAVMRTLDGQPGIEPRELAGKREFASPEEPVVERLVGAGDHAVETEADLVAMRIRDWVNEGAHKYSDLAILVRALSSTPPFEQALGRLGIPFVVSGGRTFLEARETRDVMALLAALVNPLDEVALVGVLRSPLVGWSDERIFREGREGWQREFENLFGRGRRLAGFLPPDQVVAMILDECGYAANLPDRVGAGSARADRVRANLEKLLAWMRREHRSRPRPSAELLEDLEALRATQSEAEAPPDAAEAVRILSIHAAKGLEFPVVFVSALQRPPDRRSPVLLFSSRHGLGAKWRNPVTGEAVSDAAHAALEEERKQAEKAEENRLLYVATTRAEKRLILSYAQRKQAFGWQRLVEAAVPAATEATTPPEPRAAERRQKAAATPELVYDRIAPAGQYDSSAAVTSVALFNACPRKYYLGRYLGMEPEPQGPGTGAIELGLEVHRALAGAQTDSADAKELAERFNTSELGQRAMRAGRVEREFDFLLALEDVVLRGQIDLWFEEAGELLLVDYKTDRDESAAAEYALQLRLYALALERYAGRMPDHAVLYYLRADRAHEVSLARADLDAARAAVRALADAQNSLEFPVKVGERCRRCPFYGGLCPAKPAETA